MKRVMICILCLLLMSTASLTCFAAGETLTLTDATTQPGEMVYMTLMLNEPVVGNTIGISYTYDSALLQVVPDSCSWAKEGVLQDFSKKGSGVWASASSGDLQGSVCVLAFSVAEDAVFTKTEVSCKLIVKNNSDEVGTYTASAVVSQACDHDFGDWKNVGGVGHSRTCKTCQATQTENHNWDEGKLSDKPGDPSKKLKTYTCLVCGGTKQQEVDAPSVEVTEPTHRPTRPEVETTVPTFPTKPTEKVEGVTPPTEPTVKPTEPNRVTPTTPTTPSGDTQPTQGREEQENTEKTPYRDYNRDEISHPEDEHSHEDPLQEAIDRPVGENQDGAPVIIPAGDSESLLEEHDHDHDHETVSGGKVSCGTAAAVLGVLVLAVAGSILYIKKKR